MEKALMEHRSDPENKSKKNQLHLMCMLYCFHDATDDLSMSQAIKLVEESERASKFLETKPN
jgi:hypothetical protein